MQSCYDCISVPIELCFVKVLGDIPDCSSILDRDALALELRLSLGLVLVNLKLADRELGD